MFFFFLCRSKVVIFDQNSKFSWKTNLKLRGGARPKKKAAPINEKGNFFTEKLIIALEY